MSGMRRALLAAIMLLFSCAFGAVSAQACTVAATTTNLGSRSSYVIGTTAQSGSGSAGLTCDILLAALSSHYVGFTIEASTFRLNGPNSNFIEFVASRTPGGAALAVNSFQNLSSLSLVSLCSGTNNSVPIYVRTTAKAGLRAGLYTGTMTVRWYHSVCSLGVAVCLASSNSPGISRPPGTFPGNWGTGTAVTLTVQLTIENDCIIAAPNINFNTAPVVSAFSAISQTIQIRCSAGAAYTVGLDDGRYADSGVRRMRSGTNHLSYAIFKSASLTDRWGSVGSARRSSADANTNPGTYDSTTVQSFNYRAAINPNQPTPPAGTYEDRIIVDVAF